MSTIKKARGGFTLIEMMVAVGIGCLSLAGAAALSLYTARSFTAMGNYMELDQNSRNALDRLTQLVRESDGVIEHDKHSVELSYHGGAVVFRYSPLLKTLSLTQTNGTRNVLLKDCEFLEFQVFQRNSVAGTYDQYPVTLDESAAKIVQVSWICSRQLLGSLFNTESVQSAKIVIRKQ